MDEIREAITLENNGEKIFGILHRPVVDNPVPAVIICSGFAGNKCGKFRVFVTLGKELAKHGIAVFRFDYRGSGDSDGEFTDLTLEGEISDTEVCLNFLSQDPKIDPSRIGMLGKSLGGVIAILSACRFSHIKSLALWAPVFKSKPWQQLWETFQLNGKLNPIEEELFKNLPAHFPNLEFLKEFFALDLEKHLEVLKDIPLLHIHGNNDQVVTIEHAKDFENARNGMQNSLFIKLPKSDHHFSDIQEQKIAIEETAKWFIKTL